MVACKIYGNSEMFGGPLRGGLKGVRTPLGGLKGVRTPLGGLKGVRTPLKSKRRCTCQHGTHREPWFVLGLTLDIGFRARSTHRGRAGRAGLRFGTLDHGASRSRAGRALANLTGLGAGRDTRRAVRNRGFQHILGHVRLRRAFRLEHIFRHIGHGRAGRNRGLQYPFAWIGFLAFGARNRGRAFGTGFGAGTRPRLTATIAYSIIIIIPIVESFRCFNSHSSNHDSQKE